MNSVLASMITNHVRYNYGNCSTPPNLFCSFYFYSLPCNDDLDGKKSNQLDAWQKCCFWEMAHTFFYQMYPRFLLSPVTYIEHNIGMFLLRILEINGVKWNWLIWQFMLCLVRCPKLFSKGSQLILLAGL